MLCPWSYAGDLTTVERPMVVVTPVRSHPGPFCFCLRGLVCNRTFFMSWRFPYALAKWSSCETVLVARRREWDAHYSDTYSART